MIKKKRKYWYKYEVVECLVCGRRSEDKERQYTRKPKNYYKRHIWKFRYCYCNSL